MSMDAFGHGGRQKGILASKECRSVLIFEGDIRITRVCDRFRLSLLMNFQQFPRISVIRSYGFTWCFALHKARVFYATLHKL